MPKHFKENLLNAKKKITMHMKKINKNYNMKLVGCFVVYLTNHKFIHVTDNYS